MRMTLKVLLTTLVSAALLMLVACSEQPAQETTEERPDAWVTTKVTTKLTADPEINPFKIDVDTKEGVVSLTGKVNSEADREEAERLARNTEGVRDVINNLEIQATDTAREANNAAQDAIVTGAVKAKLLADPELAGLAVDVDTADGVVSLTGTLATEQLCEKAEEVARNTSGVVDVINNLKTS